VKTFLTILVVAFIVYYVLTEPTAAANAVGALLSALAAGFNAVITFFANLF
jgi:hypothetical protein